MNEINSDNTTPVQYSCVWQGQNSPPFNQAVNTAKHAVKAVQENLLLVQFARNQCMDIKADARHNEALCTSANK